MKKKKIFQRKIYLITFYNTDTSIISSVCYRSYKEINAILRFKIKHEKYIIIKIKEIEGDYNMGLPILLAKDKNAKIMKDDYKIGWLTQDEKSWLWIVWGSYKDLDAAIKCANDTIKEKGDRPIYISDEPLSKDGVQTDKLYTRQIN